MAGSKLGPYEVLSLLGVGGMGEVYRGRDPRLDRPVAIKVLPAERMADENRRRRFTQEARMASALNHANIVTIYEIESAEGTDFIVMELMAGSTLDAVIPRQGMRLGEALRIAIPIADAIACAHAAGVIHRDLKPTNIMVGSDGVAKVLDFGLAKLIVSERGAPDDATWSENGEDPPLSRPGVVVGTSAYMSPEQASGGEVDARSDVFSFGAVLYEMVTGRRAFSGRSAAETQAAVIKDQPKLPSELVPELPRELDRLIQRCLRKEAGRRFQHMLDLKLELEQIKLDSESGRETPRPAPSRRGLWIGAGLAAAAVVVATALFWRRPTVVPAPPPRAVPLSSMKGDEVGVTLSPDGDRVAFAWNGEKVDNYDIYAKLVGSSEPIRLTSDPAMEIMPAWSPDGRQIAFVRNPTRATDPPRTIQLISAMGGSVRKLSDFPVAFSTPSWSSDSRWLAVAGDDVEATGPGPLAGGSTGFDLLPVDGGEPRHVSIPQATGVLSMPRFSHDGRSLAYVSCHGMACSIAVVELGPDFLPAGLPHDITRRPFWVSDGLAWSRDGKSLIFSRVGITRLWRVAIDGEHEPEPIEVAGYGAMRPATAVRSDRLAFVQGAHDEDIYRFQMGHAAEPAIASSYFDEWPQFSPDGQTVAFGSARSGEMEVWLARADGSSARQLTHGQGLWQCSPYWSPDGRRVLFNAMREDGHFNIWVIDADGGSPRQLTRERGDQNDPSWSRDGRFIYYTAEPEGATSGQYDVWRVPAAGGAAERMTEHGGGFAEESIDGKTLFFIRQLGGPSPLLARPVAGGPERRVAECVLNFGVARPGIYSVGCPEGEDDGSFVLRDPATGRKQVLGKPQDYSGSHFGVSPDGKTILYTRVIPPAQDLMLIENFQ